MAILVVAAAASAVAGGEIGVSLDAVTVPIESITVSEALLRPLSAEKIAEQATGSASVTERIAAVERIQDQDALVKIIRNDSSSDVRMAAFDRLVDGDRIFAMVFKPGSDAIKDIRPAAIRAIADVEVVKMLAARLPDGDAKEVAKERLASVYASPADRELKAVHPSVLKMARRMSSL